LIAFPANQSRNRCARSTQPGCCWAWLADLMALPDFSRSNAGQVPPTPLQFAGPARGPFTELRKPPL